MKNDTHNDTHPHGRNGDEHYRRVELITGTTRQLRRGDEERARILAESFEPARISRPWLASMASTPACCTIGESAQGPRLRNDVDAGAAVYSGDDRRGEQGRRWRDRHLGLDPRRADE